MAKYKYEYCCPDCGTQLELKMRVTQTRRKCPHCGTPITPEEIDRQAADRQWQQLKGCLGCLGLPVAAAVTWFVWQGVVLPIYNAIAAWGAKFWVILCAALLAAGVIWWGWVTIQAERRDSR